MMAVVISEGTRGGRVRDMVVRAVNPQVAPNGQRCGVAGSNPTGPVIEHAFAIISLNLF